MAYTERQRSWYHRVYGHRCAFYEFKNGIWQRCPNRKHLEVHHILPVRWSKRWIPNFNRDSCLNGILICRDMHHFLIHPDLDLAFQEYRTGNKKAFEMMIKERDEMANRGEPYWNRDWDFMLRRLSRKFIYRHYYHQPDDPFPRRQKRRKKRR